VNYGGIKGEVWERAALLSQFGRGSGLLINGDKKVEWPKLPFPIFGLAFTALHDMTPDCEKKIPSAVFRAHMY
jgi:hypothetical protein